MPSLFLHRISVVRVYLSVAATTQDPADRDLHQYDLFELIELDTGSSGVKSL